MEAPDRCCNCNDDYSDNSYYEKKREDFLKSPEGIKWVQWAKDQKELKRLAGLPREVTKEQYEKTISEYDLEFGQIFDKNI